MEQLIFKIPTQRVSGRPLYISLLVSPDASDLSDMSPIGKLPAELILEIMLHSVLQATEFPFDRTLAAINLSHVCGEWRSVALDHRRLWVNAVNLATPTMLLRNAIIPRCKKGTIESIILPGIAGPFLKEQDWDLDSPSVHDDPQVTDVIERLSLIAPILDTRPKQIIVKIPTRDWQILDSQIFSKREMTQLETLLLIRDNKLHNFFTSGFEGSLSVPALDQALRLADSSWMLKTVGFQGCTAFLDSPAFSMVEHLIIQKLPPSISYTPDTLLKILKRMTRLKVLKLEIVTLTIDYPDRTQEFLDPDPEMSIKLPNLEQIHLVAPIDDIRQLIYSLKTPAGCRFDILADEFGEDPYDQDRLELIVDELERKTSSRTIAASGTSACLEFDANHYTISVVEGTPEGEENTQLLRLRCEWGFDIDNTFMANEILMSRLHQLRHATSLKVDLLEIRDDFFESMPDIDDILTRFNKVVVLQMYGPDTYKFFLSYFQMPCQPICVYHPQFLPSLKSLIFRSVDFSQKPDKNDDRNLGEILSDFVSRRSFVYSDQNFLIRSMGSWNCTGLSLDTIVAMKRHGTDVVEMLNTS